MEILIFNEFYTCDANEIQTKNFRARQHDRRVTLVWKKNTNTMLRILFLLMFF